MKADGIFTGGDFEEELWALYMEGMSASERGAIEAFRAERRARSAHAEDCAAKALAECARNAEPSRGRW